MERNTRDAELSETPQNTSGSLRVFYAPREDVTAEDELSALANVYKFVLERHKEHKKDTGTERGESTHGVPRAKSGIRRQGMMSSDGHLERVLARLDGVEKGNGYFRVHCPAHDDHNPSLSVKEVEENGQRKVLLRCFAGCDKERILEELGLEWRDLYSKQGSSGSEKSSHIVATYNYTDASGNLLHQTVRYEPKRFSQRCPDGKGGWEWSLKGIEPVLYCLPDVMRAVLDGKTVFLVEGEKDADHAREELGITATTSPMGAKK